MIHRIRILVAAMCLANAAATASCQQDLEPVVLAEKKVVLESNQYFVLRMMVPRIDFGATKTCTLVVAALPGDTTNQAGAATIFLEQRRNPLDPSDSRVYTTVGLELTKGVAFFRLKEGCETTDAEAAGLLFNLKSVSSDDADLESRFDTLLSSQGEEVVNSKARKQELLQGLRVMSARVTATRDGADINDAGPLASRLMIVPASNADDAPPDVASDVAGGPGTESDQARVYYPVTWMRSIQAGAVGTDVIIVANPQKGPNGEYNVVLEPGGGDAVVSYVDKDTGPEIRQIADISAKDFVMKFTPSGDKEKYDPANRLGYDDEINRARCAAAAAGLEDVLPAKCDAPVLKELTLD